MGGDWIAALDERINRLEQMWDKSAALDTAVLDLAVRPAKAADLVQAAAREIREIEDINATANAGFRTGKSAPSC
jgi:hypothetical protein